MYSKTVPDTHKILAHTLKKHMPELHNFLLTSSTLEDFLQDFSLEAFEKFNKNKRGHIDFTNYLLQYGLSKVNNKQIICLRALNYRNRYIRRYKQDLTIKTINQKETVNTPRDFEEKYDFEIGLQEFMAYLQDAPNRCKPKKDSVNPEIMIKFIKYRLFLELTTREIAEKLDYNIRQTYLLGETVRYHGEKYAKWKTQYLAVKQNYC